MSTWAENSLRPLGLGSWCSWTSWPTGLLSVLQCFGVLWRHYAELNKLKDEISKLQEELEDGNKIREEKIQELPIGPRTHLTPILDE